jgi:hypothetical protein
MRLSRSGLTALAAVLTAPLLGSGCGAGNATPDGGGGGSGGAGVPPANVRPEDLLSDFEEGQALVLPLGSPARNGYWYSYNDASTGCLQSPAHGDMYYPSTPAASPPGPSRGRALHANWINCAAWGAGVGADFNAIAMDGGVAPAKPRMPYDLTAFTGIAFWAMATAGTDPTVRVKMVMRASTQIQDGGTCDEAVLGTDRCGDEWGVSFSLPTDGTWKAITVRFNDPGFKPEGWGQPFAWNPADVLGIQFQSSSAAGLYDFWIDDIYLLR